MKNHEGIVEEESWGINHGGEILERNQERGIQEQTNPGGGSKQEKSRKRNPVEKESNKSNPGAGIRKRTWSKSLARGIMVQSRGTRKTPRRHPGRTQRHPGGTEKHPFFLKASIQTSCVS